MDVVHRLHHPPGAAAGRRAMEGSVRHRRGEIGPEGMGAAAILDRRHPPVPTLLALRYVTARDARGVSRVDRPLPTDDGAARGAEGHRDRDRDRLRTAGIAIRTRRTPDGWW